MCRSRGVCEAAGYVDRLGTSIACKGALSWAHILSRVYHRIRYLKENCFCLCMGHHVYFGHRPIEWEWFVLGKIGDRLFAALKHAAVTGPKLDPAEVLRVLNTGAWPTLQDESGEPCLSIATTAG